ncbi:MAG TPA: hypothetical protein VM784_00140 [Actinomycetota bacterium]|nr:hypothetical protein [Actinomycetota bacterium]
MNEVDREDGTEGPALEAVLRAQEEQRAKPDRPTRGATTGGPTRVQYTALICGTSWVAAMLLPLRFGDGLPALYVGRMTLVIGAIAIPMLLVEDRTLWESKRSRLADAIGMDMAMLLGGLLYLLTFFVLFQLMDLFW